MDLPKFKSHKVVEAAKIAEISAPSDQTSNGSLVLEGAEAVFPPASYFEKHDPQVGGYYVVYEDGYASFSPAEAFESGYTSVDDGAVDELAEANDHLQAAQNTIVSQTLRIFDLERANEEQAHKIADLEMVGEDPLERPTVDAVWGDEGGDELEKFLRSNAGAPLRITVESRTNLVRVASIDQTQVLEGAVHGNRFEPKR